ncbi:MAG: hypothetical protein JXR78_10715 [Victivallales bacterium]|nr:hypothetical protein [Victivallales bacterium]
MKWNYVLLISLLINAQTGFTKEVTTEKIYDGVATPVISTTIRFGYNDAFRGIITYVARPGSILRGPEYDATGKVIRPGTLLVKMKTDYRKSVVDGKLAELESAEANLKNAKDNYDRFSGLIKTDATSMQIYQQSLADYLSAIGHKKAAEADVKLAQVMLDACTFEAPFDAIVDNVYFPSGLCAGELDIVKISQLFPMGIKVKMDRESALKITPATMVKVYPCGSDQALGIFHGMSYLLPDGIMFRVNNYQLPSSEGGKNLPVCRTSPVFMIPFDGNMHKSVAAVPQESILKDEAGYYLWAAKDQLDARPDKVQDMVFAVKKVRIVPDDRLLGVEPHSLLRVLRDSGGLKAFSTILTPPFPENLKDDDKVCIYNSRYLFMPGDPVKVVIGQ